MPASLYFDAENPGLPDGVTRADAPIRAQQRGAAEAAVIAKVGGGQVVRLQGRDADAPHAPGVVFTQFAVPLRLVAGGAFLEAAGEGEQQPVGAQVAHAGCEIVVE